MLSRGACLLRLLLASVGLGFPVTEPPEAAGNGGDDKNDSEDHEDHPKGPIRVGRRLRLPHHRVRVDRQGLLWNIGLLELRRHT